MLKLSRIAKACSFTQEDKDMKDEEEGGIPCSAIICARPMCKKKARGCQRTLSFNTLWYCDNPCCSRDRKHDIRTHEVHIKILDEQEATDNSSQFKEVMTTHILLLLVKAGKTSSHTWTCGSQAKKRLCLIVCIFLCKQIKTP